MLLVMASKSDAKVRVGAVWVAVTEGRVDGARRIAMAGALRSGRVTRCYLAVDVGGTKLAAGVVDDSGRILVRDRLLTPPRDVWPTLVSIDPARGRRGTDRAGRMWRRMRRSDRSVRRERSRRCTSRVGAGFPLASELEELLQLPVAVDTDARALALAEAWCGGAVGVSDFIGVVMGTGVGGGVVSGGQLLQGRVGNAGYIGHVVVEPDGRPCICGGKGCLETYCSGRAIEAETGRPPQRAPGRDRRTNRRDGRPGACVGRRALRPEAGDRRRIGRARVRRAVLPRRAGRARQAGPAAVHQRLPGDAGHAWAQRAPLIGAAALVRRQQ